MDRVGARATSWIITIAVAFFPAFVSADFPLSANLFEVARAAYDKNHFHDFYFAGMVLSVFSLSNLWDSFTLGENIAAKAKKVWRFFARLIYAFFIIVLVYGVWEYISIRREIISPQELNRDVWLLIIVLIVSLGTEMMIAFSESKKELLINDLLKKEAQLDLLRKVSPPNVPPQNTD
jgi:uncharacterized membrane protein